MKRVNNLYNIMISEENIRKSILEVNSTHRGKPHHKPNKTVLGIESDIDARIKELQSIINSGYVPTNYIHRLRYDKSAEKWRDIYEPRLYPDQYIHHILINVLKPIMMRGMDKGCCGSIKNRGVLYGKNALEKGIRTDTNIEGCLELDIKHFYESIKPKYIINRFKHLIKDYRVLQLIDNITKDGIIIGAYTSQGFANVLLQPLDQLIRKHSKRYLRYMDNFTIFSDSKEKLFILFSIIKDGLSTIDLTIKSNGQIFNTKKRLPNALGYRYNKNYTIPRKRNLLRLKRQLSIIYKKIKIGKQITVHMALSTISRLGQLKHCKHYNFYKNYIQKGLINRLKNIIRSYSKRNQKGTLCT